MTHTKKGIYDWLFWSVLVVVQVSDRGLSFLAGLEHLEYLSLISCNNVSDNGLNWLRSGCKSLQVRLLHDIC